MRELEFLSIIGCALRHLRTHAREFQKQLAGRGRHQPTQRHLAGIFHSLVIFSRHSKFDLSWEYLSDTSTSKNVSLSRLTKRSVKSEKAAKNRILSILIIYSTSKIKYEDSTFIAPTRKRLTKMAEQFDVVSLRKCSSNWR